MPTINMKNHRPSITQKRCRVCGEVKPVAEFMTRSDSFDGYMTDCRICTNERKKREAADRKLRTEYNKLKP